MKKVFISSMAVLAVLSVTSCKTDFETDVADIAVTSGEADFSKYVALGNSLTSGYRDGTVYLDGQLESYPAMIAEQMQKAGGGTFTQPLVPDNIGGFANIPGFKGKLTLQVVNGALTPVYSTAVSTLDRLTGTYNNMGVPGAKSFHLVANGYGNMAGLASGTANPYFVRFASSSTASVLDDAKAQNPTFFSLWIGNNDVLSYATSGGVGTNQTGNTNPRTYSSNDITDPNVLAGSIRAVLEGMKSVGATKGVIANIPNVTSIPFFTTVPYNAVPLDEAHAAALNTQLVGRLKPVLTALGQGDRLKTLVVGQNPLLIKDETLTDLSSQITAALTSNGVPATLASFIGTTYGQARHTTSEDLVLLSTKPVINSEVTGVSEPFNKLGVTYPLEDKHVLIKSEVAQVQTATNAYNTQIKALAEAYGLAFVDANAKMVELGKNSGIQYNGVNYSTTFVTGGSFSLDGVHLTGKGYAVIANEFIKAINAKYKSNLRQVNPNNYSGVKFP
jgi:hypothetical lipoprotein